MSGTTSQDKKLSQASTKKPTETQSEEVELSEEEKFFARLAYLEEQNEMLKTALSKFATLSGHGNYLKEFGLKRWEPSKKDMSKF